MDYYLMSENKPKELRFDSLSSAKPYEPCSNYASSMGGDSEQENLYEIT